MSKTGTQLKPICQSLAEAIVISDAQFIMWANDFLVNKLRTKAMIKSTQLYANSVNNTNYALPATFEEVWKVEQFSDSSMTEPNKYGEYFDYELDEGYIQFSDSGHFKLHYFILPTEISVISGSIAIDSAFYKPLCLWVAYCALTNDDEDNALPSSLGIQRFREFHAAMSDAINDRKSRIKKPRRIRVRKW